MKFGYTKQYRDRPWADGDRKQLLILHCFGHVGWGDIGRYFQHTPQNCRAEAMRIMGKGNRAELRRVLGDERIAELLGRATTTRAGLNVSRAETRNRVIASQLKDSMDWQEKNQPGAFTTVETKVAGVTARKRKYSTVLDKYRGFWLADKEKGIDPEKRRGITPDQHETGEDFTEDYMVAVSSLGAKGVDLASAGSGSGRGFDESLAAAHEGVTKAFRMMTRGTAGKNGSMVVQRVCGHNETLAAVEASMGWKEGHAIIRLREGLNDMMPYYQKLRDRRRKAG